MEEFKICSEEIEALQNWARADKENRAILVIAAERNGDRVNLSGALKGLAANIAPALGQYMLKEKSLQAVI